MALDNIKEAVKKMGEMYSQMEKEDKQNSAQLEDMDKKFTEDNKLTQSHFNEIYSDAVKNFRLDFGTVCEKGRDEVIQNLPKAKDLEEKEKIAKEYLTCVELTRLKAAQRAQQSS